MQWPFLINAFYAREVIMPPQPQVRRYMACDCHATLCNNMIDTKKLLLHIQQHPFNPPVGDKPDYSHQGIKR
jgi:hypothetical protein